MFQKKHALWQWTLNAFTNILNSEGLTAAKRALDKKTIIQTQCESLLLFYG